MTTFARLIDGIPEVANASDLAARFATPNTGQKVYRLDLDRVFRYSGSAWVGIFGAGAIYDVTDKGATGNGTTDDTTAIQAAITAAAAAGGGVVFFPNGTYKTTAVLTVPVGTSNSIVLKGEGWRDSIIYPATAGQTGVLFGTATPDASGTSTNNIAYCGMEDLSINGSLMLSGTGIGLQVTQAQHCWFDRIIVEAFPNSSIGIYLRGSTTSGGVGAAAAPHTWRCDFTDMICTTCKRPWVLENVDECLFVNCDAGALTAQSTQTYAWEILQGHNNRWSSCLASGDTTTPDGGTTYTYRANYRGFGFRTPSNGDNLGADLDGVVAEGFEHMVWVESSTVSDVSGYDLNASICHYKFYNGANDGGAERANRVNLIFIGSDHTRVLSTRLPTPEPLTFTASDVTPSIKGSNVFACAATGSGPITNFDDGISGQMIAVRLTASYALTHDVTKIRCPGASDVTAAAQKWVLLVLLGTVWQVLSVSTDA